jgi:outer membrane receptor protein involved in Fe transport
VHQFKFGLAIENERYFRTLDQGAQFFLTPPDPRATPPGASFIVVASLDPHSEQRALANAVGIYAEDVIRPISNLSITAGLRV